MSDKRFAESKKARGFLVGVVVVTLLAWMFRAPASQFALDVYRYALLALVIIVIAYMFVQGGVDAVTVFKKVNLPGLNAVTPDPGKDGAAGGDSALKQ